MKITRRAFLVAAALAPIATIPAVFSLKRRSCVTNIGRDMGDHSFVQLKGGGAPFCMMCGQPPEHGERIIDATWLAPARWQ